MGLLIDNVYAKECTIWTLKERGYGVLERMAMFLWVDIVQ